MFRCIAAIALIALPLAGCGVSEQFALPYTPGAARAAGPDRPVVTVGAITDERTDGQANTAQFGTIRGGYGNPLFRLSANAPVSGIVAQAMRDGLAARGLLSGEAGPYELRGRVIRFNASKLLRVEATVEIEGSLVNRATGAIAWTGRGLSTVVETGNILAAGIAADPEELRGAMLRAMSAAVDQMLDRPDFAAALR